MIKIVLQISVIMGCILTAAIYGFIIWAGFRNDKRRSKKKHIVPLLIAALLATSCATTNNARVGYLVSVTGATTNVHRLTTTQQVDAIIENNLGFCMKDFRTDSLLLVSDHVQITLNGKDIYLQQVKFTGRKANGQYKVRKLQKNDRKELLKKQ